MQYLRYEYRQVMCTWNISSVLLSNGILIINENHAIFIPFHTMLYMHGINISFE